MMWTCATCGKIPGRYEGCDDAFPDDCDSCWSSKVEAIVGLMEGLFGWMR